MSIHSKFKFWAFLLVLLLLLVTGLLIFVTKELLTGLSFPEFGVFVFFLLFIFIWIWVVFGELRTKIIRVHIQNQEVVVSNFFGFGPEKVYRLTQFDGFETALLPSKYDTYEYLYLISNGKRVVKLSQFYHRNYSELKEAIAEKLQNLGEKDFSLLQEVKEIFI